MVFFTSDTHFHHKNVIKYNKRPFDSIEEMNAVLIQNWNKVVGSGDIVYVIGDLSYCCSPHDTITILDQLNGNIILIKGSHDNDIEFIRPHLARVCDEIYHLFPFSDKRMSITLCHHPLLSWPRSHYGTWHLFGHHHGGLKIDPSISGKSFDVGVDCWDYRPISLSEVVAHMETLPENFNFIPPDSRNKRN